ncbi:amino acid transporter [Microbacterium schleiferi]|uniref:Amino acid transporter n=1 Tax=Microbacterium schleiferi TaxID=69362 RepID=A0A7S8RHJ6_9MICO|nr:amino acid transporter [Microbacterium schleiferi]QPE04487.1 amino acid transporter [Microbacterium schleiferi]
MTDKPSRREIMRPVQLLGLAFAAALFAGIVTLVSMGFFQQIPAEDVQNALVVAGIIAGVTFVVTLVVVALLLLVIDPADVTKTIDRPVLLDEEPESGEASATTPDDRENGGASAPTA